MHMMSALGNINKPKKQKKLPVQIAEQNPIVSAIEHVKDVSDPPPIGSGKRWTPL